MDKKEQFYSSNYKSVNKIIEKILLYSNILPVLFVLLSYFHIFRITYIYSLTLQPVTIILFIVLHIINKYDNLIKFSMYFSLICADILITYLATNHHVGIYIAFGFVASMSSLYYNKKLTVFSVIISYFSMALACWIRSFDVYKIDTETATALGWYIPHLAGYTIEFIFVYLISTAITKRSYNTLERLFKIQTSQDLLVEELNDSNAKINKIAHKFKTQNMNLHDTQMNIIKFVAKVLGSHDLFTGRHVIHTQKYVDIICRQMKMNGVYTEELTDENINLFKTAAFLHDIGKIHIPEGVLNKMGKFTDTEFQLMQCHPKEGEKLLEYLPQIEDGKFNQIAHDMALYHHEKWDGTGYPNKIAGKDIPLCARIMTAADVLDALISERLYKKPFSIDKAMQIFEESKGTQFEPCIADAVIACKPLIFVIDQEFKRTESEEQAEELAWWQRYHADLQAAKLGKNESIPENKDDKKDQ